MKCVSSIYSINEFIRHTSFLINTFLDTYIRFMNMYLTSTFFLLIYTHYYYSSKLLLIIYVDVFD